MTPFQTLRSRVIPLDRRDVDTDAILPKQYMAMIGRDGFGRFLFDNWRYLDPGDPWDNHARTEAPSFVLNQAEYRDGRILLCRENFGCGSSREHAVWALADWGIRALVAPSFGDIFYGNCCKNGILPITLEDTTIDMMFRKAISSDSYALTIDLPSQCITDSSGWTESFTIDGNRKHLLVSGRDEVEQTLAAYRARIAAFEADRSNDEPWLFA
ncbi:3-isopropylmalate dehydratase small subunit [Burkholderia metallica]|uniref:3-isopropylmalate dehydratase small subunit n=1 Tax=Burkholderia metallica TaxID=488729 RepID=UPI00157A48FF|nr:3-isopropylmalate dehydratase small subunit [Burkholderia metallica]NTZ89078.1 3-isopropylmalate dehydratase small subunit [Burkholderia metallica]